MKIIERSLSRRHSGRKGRKLETKVVTSAQGKRIHSPRVDSDSASFSEDLLDSFARNVSRARRENKALFGRQDGGVHDSDD